MLIYKIAPAADWTAAAPGGSYKGSADDLADGFLHFSTKEQLNGTLELHFKGRDGLLLIAVEADQLGDELKWEPARDGQNFPHLYRELFVDEAVWARPLTLGADGVHQLPDELG